MIACLGAGSETTAAVETTRGEAAVRGETAPDEARASQLKSAASVSAEVAAVEPRVVEAEDSELEARVDEALRSLVAAEAIVVPFFSACDETAAATRDDDAAATPEPGPTPRSAATPAPAPSSPSSEANRSRIDPRRKFVSISTAMPAVRDDRVAARLAALLGETSAAWLLVDGDDPLPGDDDPLASSATRLCPGERRDRIR